MKTVIILLSFALSIIFNSAFSQPTITSFSPSSGAVGTTVTISGSNFSTNLGDNIVFFGATKATVINANSSILTVEVPLGTSHKNISVTNLTNGLTAYSNKPFILTFPYGGAINASSFAPKVDFTAGTTPYNVSVADIDLDGKVDLIVTNNGANNISVLRNISTIGNINFSPKVDFTVGSAPVRADIADFNGDGKLDIAVLNSGSNSISILKNISSIGNISFAAKIDYTTTFTPYVGIAAGDLDVDGKPDIIITCQNRISHFRNTSSVGAISFATRVDITAPTPYYVEIGEIDGDGRPEIIVTAQSNNYISVYRNTSVLGTISFAASVNLPHGAQTYRCSIGDLDNDGKLDIVSPNAMLKAFRNTSSIGSISFAASVQFPSVNSVYPGLGDLNGDGKIDVAMPSSGTTIQGFQNISSVGSISFNGAVNYTTNGISSGNEAAVVDIDGDGRNDMTNAFSVLRNIICGSFSPTVSNNGPVCVGSALSLTAANVTGATYQWSGPNGFTSTQQNPTVSSTAITAMGGVYSVIATVNGCASSAGSTSTTVNPLPVAAGTITGSATVCQGQNAVTYTVPTIANATSYIWTLPSGATGTSTTNSISVNYGISATSGNITVKGDNSCGQGTASNLSIAVNPTTLPTFTQVPAICSGATLIALPTTSTNSIVGSWSPALNNTTTTTYTFTPTSTAAPICATTTTMAITVNALTTPTFTQVPAICSGATLNALPITSNNSIVGTWSPALNNTATTTYTFTPTSTTSPTCATTTTMAITVNVLPTATITAGGATTFCQGASVVLNANTGSGLTYQWKNNGTNITSATTASYTASTAGSYTVVVTNSNGCIKTSTANTVTVNPLTTPTFTQVPAICSGATLSALPTTSNNSIAGTWSPALNNTATTTYTFTPSSTASPTCATTTTMAITVNALPTATITAVGATSFCQGASVVLNANTGSGLTYQWKNNGTNISGATVASYTASSAGSYTVVVTNSNGCIKTSTATTVTVNPLTTPTFTQVPAICSGATLNALPTTSNNSIVGTWSPALNNTSTTTYTFTPSSTASPTCATTTTMMITVNTLPSATITAGGPTTFCQGGSVVLNANTGAGLTYQWKNNGTNISGATAASYTATTSGSYTVVVTNSNGCIKTSTGTTVTVNPLTIPTFTQVPAICSGATLSALPTTSTNSITGTWSPALNNTATTTYTFTPSSAASPTCATTTTMAITVNASTTPTFTQVAAICSGASLNALPTTSNNSIVGTWSPALNNTATTTYTFTPSSTAAPTCAITRTMTITVNALPTATITAGGPTTVCQGGSVVLNANTGAGLTYQWKNNGTNISGATGASYTASTTGSYTVVVTNSNGCIKTSTGTTVTVNPLTTPTFTQVPAICSGATLSALPTTSTNSITGTWSPTLNNTATTTYTFTPTSTTSPACATITTMLITVNTLTTPTFTQVPAICSGATLNSLPTTSNNSIAGTWSPALNNTTTTTYTFTPTSTASPTCATTTTMAITVNALPTATITTVGVTNLCQGDSVVLNVVSDNGTVYQWTESGNDINLATAVNYTAIASGSYSVFVTNSNNCSSTSAATIVNVNPLTTPTFTQVAAICSGSTLSALPIISNNSIAGSWSPALNNTTTTTYSFVPTSLAFPICATSTTMIITVNQLPVVSLATFNSVCDTAGLVNLTGGSPAGGTYSGTSVSNNAFNTTIGSGTYPITYNFSDNNGCSSSATSNLTVIDCSGASFVELTANEVSVYPNPADNIFTIEVSDFIIGQTFAIYDIRGRLLLNGKLNETKTPINVSSFATGTYYVNLPESNKMMKIIKQ